MSSYHGWTHAPKEDGGTDPIPGLGAVDIPIFRGSRTTTQTIAGITQVEVPVNDYENRNPEVFDPILSGSDVVGMSFLVGGVYAITYTTYWELGVTWNTELTLTIGNARMHRTQSFAPSGNNAFSCNPCFSAVIQFPTYQPFTDFDPDPGDPVGSCRWHVAQLSGSSKDMDDFYVEITQVGTYTVPPPP